MTFPELLYYLGCSIKKHHALKHQKRLPGKVISIGNITLGGTGKTPATIAVSRQAQKKGFHPCILTRGYKGTARGPCLLSAGEKPLLNEYQAGDEALLMAEKLQGIPVIKGKDRLEAGVFALRSLPRALCPDLFVLDDGFQHWSLFRDKDVLLIDSTNPFGNGRLLPLGKLREPVSSIERADVIVLTRTDASLNPEFDSLVKGIRQKNNNAPVYFAEHRPVFFVTKSGDTFRPEWAEGKRFFGFCGIGNPKSFEKTLYSLKVKLKGLKTYRDHHRYSAGDLREITGMAEQSRADWIVTTEKDIMRIREMHAPRNLVAIAVEFIVEESFYSEIFHF